MATDFTDGDVNNYFWPGPSAAGQGKPDNNGNNAGATSAGYHNCIWNGLSAIGTPKNNTGPNVIGTPKAPAQPT